MRITSLDIINNLVLIVRYQQVYINTCWCNELYEKKLSTK